MIESNSTPAAAAPVVRRFALNKIHPDANARQEFDPAKLQELADSLLDTKGVLQPLLGTLRADGEVDLIAGERRWRASGLAGFAEVEVKLVEKPSRKDHLKWNLVENLQREDLTPIETAMRVKEMLELNDEASGLPQYNRASLATELGISAESVGRYEQLLRAPEKVKKAVNDKGLDMFIAALIGSLAESMREQAAKDMVFRVHGGPMNRAEAQRYVAENCRRDLRKGQFDREDATLVPDAGACSGCPFFGLNSETVAGKARGYTCLNPECFNRKQQAHVNKVADAAENEGSKVLPQTMTNRVFQNWNNEVSTSCGYVDVKRAPDGYLLKEQKGKIPHWEKILEGTGAEVVVAFDHEGRVRRLVETKIAIEAAKHSEHADLFKPKAGADVESADDKKATMQISKAKNKAGKAALLEGLCAMFESFSGQAWSRDVRLTLLADLCGNQTRDDLELLCRILQPDLKGISNARAKLAELIDLRLDTDAKIDAFILIARKIRSIHFRGFDFKQSGYESTPDMLLYCEWAGFDAPGWDKKMDQRIKDAERETKALIKEKNKPAKKVKGKVVKAAPENLPTPEVPAPEAGSTPKFIITDKHRAFYQGNPKCNVTDLQKKFSLDRAAAIDIFDTLVDEKFDAKAPTLGVGSLGKGPARSGVSGNAKDFAKAAAKKATAPAAVKVEPELLAGATAAKPSGAGVAVNKKGKPELWSAPDIELGATLLMNEAETITELIGPKPDRKKDEQQYKTWNSVRMKLLRKAGLAA